ncbi:MAG: DUF2867 domain-containing protein [Gemmatimonadetes bacterium]|nr:DUF2867 domain-containing protein [Gemmatimonadota bacterium]MDA1104750.1 DUF2867 domain-containing protein [Gemmatimonadota bacterium]
MPREHRTQDGLFKSRRPVLVTGATGYVGGRLVQELLDAGHAVRVMARDAKRASARSWGPSVEIVEADLMDIGSLAAALDGVSVAYYLVHSMCSGDDFAETDRRAARNFVAAGVALDQLIYLGGILPEAEASQTTSEHLRSRAEIGSILHAGLPVTEFRAGPIIGGGSASFEMVRYLTERLPAMIAPKWILNEVQPIAIRDALSYLVAAVGRADSLGVIDIGSDRLTFKAMMERYAEVRGLPRLIIPVPVLAPSLAALWVGLVTPIPNCLAVPLVQGVVQPVVGDTTRARALFPEIEPESYVAAVSSALAHTEAGEVATRWSVAGGPNSPKVRLEDKEGVVREIRSKLVDAPAAAVFAAFSSLGGSRGWLVWNWAWKVRGVIDQIVGGPGLRRGRRDPLVLYPGEALDFWRVEEYKPSSLLRLRAEMKVPGRAWLQFEAIPEGDQTRLVQTAFFAPTGFFGWLYWYGIYPLHARIFSDLVNAIARDALTSDQGAS